MIRGQKHASDYRLYVDRRLGGQERWSIGPPKDWGMRIPDELLRCAVFLGGRDRQGRVQYRATAFLVGLPTPRTPVVGWPVLVTAKHNVLRALDQYGNVVVRVNLSDGTARDIDITDPWEFSDDDASDVAAVPFPAFAMFDMDVLPLPVNWFLTPEMEAGHKIGPGDEIVVIGLFRRHVGTQRNLPIVRNGAIAAMPEEPLIDPASGLEYHAYLAELRSIGGVSGSPVFVILTTDRYVEPDPSFDPGRSFHVVGLVRGHWNKREDEALDHSLLDDEIEPANLGIAIVTPATELLPIFERKLFVSYKKEMDKRLGQQDAPVEDFASQEEESEFERFRTLTRKLVNVPKKEIDEKRKGES